MGKGVFSLAGSVAVAIVVASAGCVGADPDRTAPLVVSDGGSSGSSGGGVVVDAGAPVLVTDAAIASDAAPSDAGSLSDADAGPFVCMKPEPLNHTTVPYQPRRVVAGACTLADLKAVDDLVVATPGGIAYGAVKTMLQGRSATCAACTFSADPAAWAPLVEQGGGKILVNLGGCVEIVSKSFACGRAWHQFDTCTNFGCQNCTTDADTEQCFKDVIVDGAPCGAAASDLRAACGSGLTNYLETCFPSDGLTIDGPIRYQCIGGSPPDSGAADTGVKD